MMSVFGLVGVKPTVLYCTLRSATAQLKVYSSMMEAGLSTMTDKLEMDSAVLYGVGV